MGHIFYDRIKDTSTTTGTGDFTVSGSAPTGFRTFSAVYSVGDKVPYVIAGQSSSEWETGWGTYTATDTLERTDPRSGSAGDNTLVTFSAGTKDVFVDAIAAFIGDVDTHGMVVAKVAGLPML